MRTILCSISSRISKHLSLGCEATLTSLLVAEQPLRISFGIRQFDSALFTERQKFCRTVKITVSQGDPPPPTASPFHNTFSSAVRRKATGTFIPESKHPVNKKCEDGEVVFSFFMNLYDLQYISGREERSGEKYEKKKMEKYSMDIGRGVVVVNSRMARGYYPISGIRSEATRVLLCSTKPPLLYSRTVED